MADGLLSDPCCAFHRNVDISSRYAWMYKRQPACFKWAAMAAIASHHIRLALFPLRLDTDRTGYVNIPHSLRRPKLLMTEDVNTIRAPIPGTARGLPASPIALRASTARSPSPAHRE